jgi:hypothetical protein
VSRSTRSRRATTALALAIWSQACVVHRPAPASELIRPGANVRIRSVAPLALTRQRDALPAVTVCCTNRARTTVLLLGITAAVIGLAALAASQIEYGFPPSGTFFVSP